MISGAHFPTLLHQSMMLNSPHMVLVRPKRLLPKRIALLCESKTMVAPGIAVKDDDLIHYLHLFLQRQNNSNKQNVYTDMTNMEETNFIGEKVGGE